MKSFNPKVIASVLLASLVATAAHAGPHPGHERKTPEALVATIPGLTQAQRDDIVRIGMENRQAQHALMEKTRAEHEQLRDRATQKLRTALGDKAYATYATWRLEQRADHRRDCRRHRMGHRPPADEADPEIAPDA